MERMTFSHRVRAATCAAAVALCLATPAAPAGAESAAATTSVSPAANLDDLDDVAVEPGSTLTLAAEDGVSYTVASEPPLPAGWSVLSKDGSLRLTVPSTAESGSVATITVERSDGSKGSFNIVVAQQPQPASDNNSKNWIDQLRGLVSGLFSS
ncbi:hypothetical protein CAPI_00595 [Corynebacterium capitovis DSM 44611]|nr:hypothetical protein CAPI_00595 [Corynebacterium capitovis DSM 44611]